MTLVVSVLFMMHFDIVYRSSMSNSEQVSVVEEISRIISEQLGLREQLEVIKIISPASNVSPTDTEFIIGRSGNQSALSGSYS